MCLLLFAYRRHPRYPLILLANRDEFYDRPAAPAATWEQPPIVAGRDLQAGGTWLGARRGGRIAAVTNVREPTVPAPATPHSRGAIPTGYLGGEDSPLDFARGLAGERYRGFNALLFDAQSNQPPVCAGNRHTPFPFSPGVHGISNGAADAPWPKVRTGRAALAQIVDALADDALPGALPAPALALLQDRTMPPDGELPDTGIGLAMERALSPVFVQIPAGALSDEPGGYGTRASTVVVVDDTGAVDLWEQSYLNGIAHGAPRHFHLAPHPTSG